MLIQKFMYVFIHTEPFKYCHVSYKIPKNGFKTPQGFGKAMKQLKRQLPKSPSKKLATVKGLVKEMGFELNTESKAHKTGKNKGLSKEITDKVNLY